MIINAASLAALRTGFQALFQDGIGSAPSQHARFTTSITSTSKTERYGWLGKLPGVREWIGDRVVHSLAEQDYEIKNKSFELTISVDRDDIEDDTLGTYSPMFREMGESTGAHDDQTVFAGLAGGFTTNCFDGQYFFDVDHPVLGADGVMASVSNYGGGAGTPWYLLCTKRAIKPMIIQRRKPWTFVSLDDPTDENVFKRKEFVYGAEARLNVGYGFWQLAYASRQALTPDNYAAARAAVMSLKGDYGRPLGLIPDLLVVPPALEGAGKTILTSAIGAAGETNKWAGTSDLMVSPWLV